MAKRTAIRKRLNNIVTIDNSDEFLPISAKVLAEGMELAIKNRFNNRCQE